MALNTEKIHIPNARLSFAHLFKPKKFDSESDPRYEATFLLDPNDPAHAKCIKTIESEVAKICKEQWGGVPKNLKGKPYGYADEDGKEYDGWAGMFYVQANCKPRPPAIVDRNPNEVLTEEDGIPYSGCYVNGSIQMWADARPRFGPRINGTLRAVQFYRHGEAFSGAEAINVSEEFEDYSEMADALDDDILG